MSLKFCLPLLLSLSAFAFAELEPRSPYLFYPEADPAENSVLYQYEQPPQEEYSGYHYEQPLGDIFEAKTDVAEGRIDVAKNITGNIINAMTIWFQPQRAMVFIVNYGMAYLVTQAMWISLHFLFWDYSQTLPAEELSLAAIRRFLANTDVALVNQAAVWGTSLFIGIMFLIPPILLRLFPSLLTKKRKRRSLLSSLVPNWPNAPRVAESRTSPAFTNATVTEAFNRLLCPICVVRIMIFNTIIYIATVVYWSLVPFMRNTMTGLPPSARGKRDLTSLLLDDDVGSNPLKEEEEDFQRKLDALGQELIDSWSKYADGEDEL